MKRDKLGRFTRKGERCTVYVMPGARCTLSHGHARRHRAAV